MAQLSTEVEKDGVQFPMPQGANGSLVDARDEEGSGATRPEAVCIDMVRENVSDVVDSGHGMTEFSSDVTSGDIVRSAGGVKVAVEKGIG